ncbi:adapter protein CIKS [Xyrichtys novacula]|uniref:Adapter protein CIKS n=1 Tax=Xyrichtys novacula TaxID=13765 RepID=A0AAV1GVT9_XYRNO|nr:adapter protein CIKS [Xyrichtys novacula]
MNSFRGPCPHMSVPVETDEHMMSSGLDQAFALACRQCREDPKTINKPEEHDCEEDQRLGPVVSLQRLPERQFLPSRFIPPAHPAHMKPSTPAGVWPGGLRDPAALYEQDFGMGGFSDQPRVCSLDEVESLEPPLTLISDANHAHYNQMGYPAVRMTGPSPLQKRCACCPPPSQPLQNPNIFYNKRHYTAEPGQHHQPSGNRPNTEQEFKHAPNPALGSGLMCAAPSRDVMHEVSVDRSVQPCPGPNTREIKRVISLPEESRNVFITYSVDVAEDMFPFVKFLTDQGFKPAIDIFDDPIQRMSITKWMDRYLNDVSLTL